MEGVDDIAPIQSVAAATSEYDQSLPPTEQHRLKSDSTLLNSSWE